jgi:hypothetical protein
VRVVHRHFESHHPNKVGGRSSTDGEIVWLGSDDGDVVWLNAAVSPQLTGQALSFNPTLELCFDGAAPSRDAVISADAPPPPHGPPRRTLL